MRYQEAFWVIIPAAGNGQRFNQSLPKQYTIVKDKTVLEHSVNLFLKCSWIKKIVLCVAPEDEYFSQLKLAQSEKIQVVVGGSTRVESVLNAVNYLHTQAHNNDWILVHDAVRPCLHPADLTQLIEQLAGDEVGGILASPVSDTLKLFQNGILQTVDRTHLWRALTPQMFRYKKLQKALIHCCEQHIPITDEASALEHYGCPIKIVQAQHANPKLTYMDDLSFISHLLQPSLDEVTT